MPDKKVLWMDSDTLANIFGDSGDDPERFKRIMDSLAEDYEIRITDVVEGEAVTQNIDPNTGERYPKDVAIEQWMDAKNITPVQTSVSGGSHAGERSIIDAIQNDPELFDIQTGQPIEGTFEIASDDANFFNPSNTQGGADYVDHKRGAQSLVEEQVIRGHVGIDDYKSLSEAGENASAEWKSYKDVMREWANSLPEESVAKHAVLDALDNWADEALDAVFSTVKKTAKTLPVIGAVIAGVTLFPDVAEAAVNGDVEKVGELLSHYGIEEAAEDATFVGTVASVWTALGGTANPTLHGKAITAIIAVGAGLYVSSEVSTVAKQAFDGAINQLQEWGVLPQDGVLNSLVDHFAHGFADIAHWMADLLAYIVEARFKTSPLVLDLDGDGIELVALADSTTYWDMDQDGFAEKSGWVKADDGLLAIDTNLDGRITDHSELFGDAASDGFADLRLLDSNNDNVIDAQDAAFSQLLVWRDLNQNGVSEADELFSLADLDIVSINLNATVVFQTNEGHDVSHISTYTVDDGVSGPQTLSIVDVWFEYDNVNTEFASDNIPLDIAALFTANLRGYGVLPDLYISSSMDNDLNDPDSLLSLLTAFSEKSLNELFVDDGSIIEETRTILFRWAGVDDVDPASRGAYVDARELEFLEALVGQGYLQLGTQPNPGIAPSYWLNAAFDMALNAISARLIAQSAAQVLFEGDAAYNPAADSFDGITGFNQDVLDSLLAQSLDPYTVTDKTAFWMQVVNVVDQTVGAANLTAGELQKLEDTLAASDLTLTTDQILERIQWALDTNFGTVGDNLLGTSSDDVLVADASNDTLTGGNGNDSLTGGLGDDNLNGGNGADTLFGGLGDDIVNGGNGADLYRYYAGQGHDILKESGSEIDTLEFGPGVTLSDLEITRISNTALLIAILPSAGTGSITIETGSLELLKFADDSIFDLRTMDHTLVGTSGDDVLRGMVAGTMGTGSDTIYGMDGNDTIYADGANETDTKVNWLYGGNGNDVLYGDSGNDELFGEADNDTLTGNAGNDTLEGGTGDDLLKGGTGDDIYVFNYGDGNDTITESNGADRIVFGEGITAGSLSVSRVSNDDVLIEIDGGLGGSIHITDQTYSSVYVIETLEFSDATTLAMTSFNLTLHGTESGETLYGVNYGGSGEDTIYGHGGDDIIYGYRGSTNAYTNYLYAGDGNDAVYGGSGVDYIEGDAGNDTLRGYNGNDQINGGDGDDTIYGGSHDDWLYGGSGADKIFGENNNDILTGGLGADELTGGSGNDIFRFAEGETFDALDTIKDFNPTYDAIDVSDVIDFDPQTDVITDFVQITTSGANSLLFVDADGGGDNFVQIAVILNKTGLTDEAALLAGGQLLAA